jgi:hypothetical protein
VAQAYASWRPVIEQALFEHYEPYAEAVTADEILSPSEASPRIAAPGDIWSHVSLVFVSVTPLSGLLKGVRYRTRQGRAGQRFAFCLIAVSRQAS